MAVATREWRALGCLVNLAVTDPGRLDLAEQLLRRQLEELDAACSRFREDSEISALNQLTELSVTVSPLLFTAIVAAVEAAADTDGAVDPTLGESMTAAGYDRDYDLLPTAAPGVTLRKPKPDAWQQIELDESALTVRLPAGVSLDLGATAKALGADLAAGAIAEAIGCGVLVGLGGDIAVAGIAPAGGWVIRVQDITGPSAAIAPADSQLIALHHGGLATSSSSARRWVRGDRLLHHILDPRSGAPVVSPWRTVTVAGASCLDANVATTAALVEGVDALEWLSADGVAARMIDHVGGVITTAGWPATEQRAAA